MQINVKTPKEIQAMRTGGRILGEILHVLSTEVAPGMTTMDLERRAEELFKQHHVEPGFVGVYGYKYILCTSVNDEAVHTPPNDVPLQKGDILSIDCGVLYEGLNTDSAVAVVVGGETSPEAQRLVDACIKATWAGIKAVKPGNHVGDIGHAVEMVVTEAGFSVIPELTGHGIGYSLHEDPHVYNYGEPGDGLELRPGNTIAIEPIVAQGSPRIETLDDDWTIVTRDGSLAIQHEHTVLVTENGVEVLTLRPGEKAV